MTQKRLIRCKVFFICLLLYKNALITSNYFELSIHLSILLAKRTNIQFVLLSDTGKQIMTQSGKFVSQAFNENRHANILLSKFCLFPYPVYSFCPEKGVVWAQWRVTFVSECICWPVSCPEVIIRRNLLVVAAIVFLLLTCYKLTWRQLGKICNEIVLPFILNNAPYPLNCILGFLSLVSCYDCDSVHLTRIQNVLKRYYYVLKLKNKKIKKQKHFKYIFMSSEVKINQQFSR